LITNNKNGLRGSLVTALQSASIINGKYDIFGNNIKLRLQMRGEKIC
jgi:hypothetical protein